jgi:hypothetical protein
MLKSDESKKKLEGLLTVIPSGCDSASNHYPLNVNKTLLNDALVAARNSQNKERTQYLFGNESNVSSFAMFTFDATWTLIQALYKTSLDGKSSPLPSFVPSSYCFNSSLKNATKYHERLKKSQFLGISGGVAFSDNVSNDRVGGAYYALENLQYVNQEQIGFVQVMKWDDGDKAKNGYWENVTRREIVWPDRSEEIPKDYPQIKGSINKFLIRVLWYCPHPLAVDVSIHEMRYAYI